MIKRIWKISTALILIFTLFAYPTVSADSQSVAATDVDPVAQIEVSTSSIKLSQNWLERFNYYRQAAGLPPVVESSAYSTDLAKHVNYMLLNVPTEGLWHGETPGQPGYTTDGAQAAAESNLYWFSSGFSYATPINSIEAWMGSIHHRYGMLNPDLVTTGFAFGCDNQNCGGGLNVIRGLVWDSNPRPNGVLYPGINQRGVDMDIILTWQFHGQPTVVLKNASLQNSSGQLVAITTSSPLDGDYFNMISVKPDALLFPGTTYTASITLQLGAIQLDQTWSFSTITFADVPLDYWSWEWIERLYNAGITGGCGTGFYCPDSTVTRAQMAVFLLKGMRGSSYTPPSVGGSTGFTDVATDYWAAAWIKQLAAEGITSGCDTGIYCPDATVTRAQMAIFLLKAEHGVSYTPPGATGVFTDVPMSYWAASWIERLAVEGITSGCGAGTYCPDTGVTRAQMAVFLVKTFNLP